MRESKVLSLSLSHTNLSKLVILLTGALFFHPLHIVVLGLLLLSPLVVILTSRLKIANRSYYYSAAVLWNNLPSDLCHVPYHVTPSPILNSPVSDLSTSHFLKKLKAFSFTLPFLLSLYLPKLSQDWYIRYGLHCFISYTFCNDSLSFYACQFFFHLCQWISVINLFNFFRQFKSSPFHIVIPIHLISLSYHILVWRFIVPKKVEQINDHLFIDTYKYIYSTCFTSSHYTLCIATDWVFNVTLTWVSVRAHLTNIVVYFSKDWYSRLT